jgi:hypothetical protein
VKTYQAPTMTELHDAMCMDLVTASADELDVISTVDVQIHNVIAEADSMDWEFDLKDLWLTPSRWTMMINQYLDGPELKAFMELCTGRIGLKGRGIATLRTKVVLPRGGEATGHTNKLTRRWGSCMLNITYKAMPHPQITLYSRTSYMGYLSALDLTVAWMVGRYLAEALGVDVKTFRFVWYNEAIQWHNFKSLAFLLNHRRKKVRKLYRALLMESEKKLLKRENGKKLVAMVERTPAIRLSRTWLQKVIAEDKAGKTLGDMTYNTYRRIRRRFHTEVMGYEYAQQFEGWSYYKTGPKKGEQKEFFKAYEPLPSTPVTKLHFANLKSGGLVLGGDWALQFDEAEAAKMADEEDE